MSVFGVILCSIYMFAGISAFIAFLILGNYPGSLWACGTGIINAITTHLHYLQYKNRLQDWYSRKELYPLKLVGFLSFTIGIIGFVCYTIIEIMLKKPMLPIDSSEVIPLVWAFITAKSGFILMYTARKYSMFDDEISEETSNLINDGSIERQGNN